MTLKYVYLLMRADNNGEGGILSLVVLVETLLKRKGGFVLALGIVGAAFFFGDAMITPAMSVLSAIEGLTVINPSFEAFVVPLTLAVLFSLFLFQYRGTAGVASIFAPVTAIWFFVMGIMGLDAYRRRSCDTFRLQSALWRAPAGRSSRDLPCWYSAACSWR